VTEDFRKENKKAAPQEAVLLSNYSFQLEIKNLSS
jgi:hypothetical protein